MFDSAILTAKEFDTLTKYCGGVSHTIKSSIRVDIVGNITGSIGEEKVETVVELSYLKNKSLIENSNYHVIDRCDGLMINDKKLEFIKFTRKWVVGNGIKYVLLFRVVE